MLFGDEVLKYKFIRWGRFPALNLPARPDLVRVHGTVDIVEIQALTCSFNTFLLFCQMHPVDRDPSLLHLHLNLRLRRPTIAAI